MEKTPLLNKFEKRAIAICLLGMLSCLGVLTVGEQFFWSEQGPLSVKPKIATISGASNDTRRRADGTFIWYKAKADGNVHAGDSIFSGANSKMRVDLDKGGSIDIGENSMIVFSEIDNVSLVNLVGGNFNLKVDGEMTVALAGKVVNLKGSRSEVQVYFSKEKRPQFRVIKGNVQAADSKGVIDLDKRAVASLNSRLADKEAMAEPLAIPVEPIPEVQEVSYMWRLHDLYSANNLELVPKGELPTLIKFKNEIRWSQGTATSALIQLAATYSFQEPQEFVSDNGLLQLNEVFHGENFWRVSLDQGKTWSLPRRLIVSADFVKDAEPQFSRSFEELVIEEQVVSTSLSISSATDFRGFVVEASLAPDFPAEQTKAFWTPEVNPRVSFYRPGDYYYRVRTVTKNLELSHWSQSKKISVRPMEKTLNNSLAKAPVIKDPSPASSMIPVEAQSLARLSDIVELKRLNQKYKTSRLSAQGFLWRLQSSQQFYLDAASPVIAGLGVHSLTWGKNWGFEGIAKTSQDLGMKNLEARGHYRFFTGFPFGLARELQTSLFAGYEMYRNTGPLFVNQYDLIKFGTSLEFPLWSKWTTGGEFVYGYAADKSTKQEISGHLTYFMNHDWSLGVGYKLNLFSAGSPESAPGNSVPYREGYTEGYSILNYHF